MTAPLATQQDIREMDARGVPRAEISRELGVSRNTVAKHAGMEGMSPTPPVPARRARPAVDAYAAWVGSVLEADLGAPRKQRRTAKRIYDRMADELGCAGSYPSVSRCVARWKSEHPPASLRDGYLELERAPGTAQADSGNFRRVLAGRPRDMKLLAMALPHSNARRCAATFSERSGCPCGGLRGTFEQIGRAPSPLVLDNATEAGRMVRGEVTESRLFSQSRAHCRCASRHCSPCSGNGKGSVENAVGLPRRNLPEPEPEPSVSSLAELNGTLRGGCERVNAPSRRRDGRPMGEALAEDPASLIPALVARPRAFGESTIRRDMPAGLVPAIDRCGKADRRRAPRAISRAAERSGSGAACAAAERVFASGRVPDDASCDLLARRVADGAAERGGADLAVHDLLAEGALRDACQRVPGRAGGGDRQAVLAHEVGAGGLGAARHAPPGGVPARLPRGRGCQPRRPPLQSEISHR